jgi:hypothetical protein
LPGLQQIGNGRRWFTPSVAVVSVALAIVLLVARSCIGVGSWGDEAYEFSTTMRYMLGDRPLVDSWDTNFSSAIMALPFLKLYTTVFNTTDGVLIAFRGVRTALVLGTALVSYRVLRELLPGRTAVALSVLIIVYIPYCCTYIGYGADYLWHMLSAMVAVRFLASPPRRGLWHAMPGLLSGLGVVANPPTVTVVPFFALALWLAHRGSPSNARRAVTWYLIGGLTVGAIFVAALRFLAGPAIFSYLEQVTSPDDHEFGIAAQIYRLKDGAPFLVLPVIAVGLVALVHSAAKGRRRAEGIGLAYVTGAAVGLFAIAIGRLPIWLAPQALIFVAASTVVTWGVATRYRLRREQLLLILPMFGAGIGWFLSSNAGFGTATLAAPLLFAAALFWWPARDTKDANATVGNRRWSSIAATVGALVLICSVAAVGALNTPEGSTMQMTARVEHGPFKGILGTPAEVGQQLAMVTAIEHLPPAVGRTIYVEHFPLGYLVGAGVLPGTYSTWATSAESDRLQTYVDLTGNAPSRIVLTKFAADFNNGRFPRSMNLRGFSGDYALIYADSNLQVFDRIAAPIN